MTIQASFEDEYQYQLYNLSKSKQDKRGNLTVFIYSAIVLGIAILNFRPSGNWSQFFVPILLIGCYILFIAFYRNYFRNRKILKQLKKTYQDIEGTYLTLTVEDGLVRVQQQGLDTKRSPALFKDVVDVDDYYFLRLQAEGAYIIPKLFNTETEAFIEQLKALNIPVVKDKWPLKIRD